MEKYQNKSVSKAFWDAISEFDASDFPEIPDNAVYVEFLLTPYEEWQKYPDNFQN